MVTRRHQVGPLWICVLILSSCHLVILSFSATTPSHSLLTNGALDLSDLKLEARLAQPDSLESINYSYPYSCWEPGHAFSSINVRRHEIGVLTQLHQPYRLTVSVRGLLTSHIEHGTCDFASSSRLCFFFVYIIMFSQKIYAGMRVCPLSMSGKLLRYTP